MFSLEEVAAMARERGISYGKMVALLPKAREKKKKPPKAKKGKEPSIKAGRPNVAYEVGEYTAAGELIATYRTALLAAEARHTNEHKLRTLCKKEGGGLFDKTGTVFKYTGVTTVKAAGQNRRGVEMINTDGEVVRVFSSMRSAAKETGIAYSSIHHACTGKTQDIFWRRDHGFRFAGGNEQAKI